MNIFKDYSGFHGEIQVEHLNKDLQEIFSLSREIRSKLGNKAYLLDEYVTTVLRGINSVNAFCAMDDCFDATCEWHRQIIENAEESTLEFQEKTTRDNLQVITSTDEFFAHAIEEYEKKCRDRMAAEVDVVHIRQLYDEICKRLGREEEMERLNFTIRQRFLIANAVTIFTQGLSENLLHSLINRDIETNKAVFVLTLEADN